MIPIDFVTLFSLTKPAFIFHYCDNNYDSAFTYMEVLSVSVNRIFHWNKK